MPARSVAQERMMAMIAHGANIPGVHISHDKAAEYVGPTKGLPTRVIKKKRKKTS